jgi:hypothetical protein
VLHKQSLTIFINPIPNFVRNALTFREYIPNIPATTHFLFLPIPTSKRKVKGICSSVRQIKLYLHTIGAYLHIKGFSVGEKVAQVTQDSPFGAFMKFEITSKHQMIP